MQERGGLRAESPVGQSLANISIMYTSLPQSLIGFRSGEKVGSGEGWSGAVAGHRGCPKNSDSVRIRVPRPVTEPRVHSSVPKGSDPRQLGCWRRYLFESRGLEGSRRVPRGRRARAVPGRRPCHVSGLQFPARPHRARPAPGMCRTLQPCAAPAETPGHRAGPGPLRSSPGARLIPDRIC